jgi:hypothetical protein
VHLAAARLLERELDLVPQPLQQPDDRSSRGREQGVAEAGDEQRQPHADGVSRNVFRKVLVWSLVLVLLMCVLVYLQSTAVLEWMVV